jgi:hypothetical protein
MKLESFLLTDTSGKKSTTLTAFILGFITVNVKLLISGLTIGGYTMSNFSGVDYSAALAALGAIYVMRRTTDKKEPHENA